VNTGTAADYLAVMEKLDDFVGGGGPGKASGFNVLRISHSALYLKIKIKNLDLTTFLNFRQN